MKSLLFSLLLAVQTAPFGETIEVRIHNVDVIVTDREGKAVHGLRKEDFELLEDGKAQPITNFAAYSESGGQALLPVPAEARQAGVPVLQPPPRTIVFFVDDMSMHPSTREKLAKSAAEMLDKTMREGDAAMVVRPTAVMSSRLELTNDRHAVRAQLAEAIETQVWRPGVAFENEMRQFQQEMALSASNRDSRLIARRSAARVRKRVEQRLASLRGVISMISPLPGRKVLVAITESLPAEPGREFFVVIRENLQIAEGNFDTPSDFASTDYVNLKPAIDELARNASSNGITIFAMQPETDMRIRNEAGANRLAIAGLASANTLTTLTALTEKTGGKFFAGDARVNAAMQQIALDVSSYYSLAYRAGRALDKPHRVEVRVRNRPDLRVRARNEVVRKSPVREMNDRLVGAMLTERMRNELGIGARAGEPVKGRKRGQMAIDVDILIPLAKLTFLPEGKVHRARFTVHYAITGRDTGFISGTEPEQVVDIPAAELAEAKSKIWRHTLHVNMDKGEYLVAVGVLDSIAQVSGMQRLRLEAK